MKSGVTEFWSYTVQKNVHRNEDFSEAIDQDLEDS